MPPSSTGVRLVEPLRLCFVAGPGKRDRKQALPLPYSNVQSNAVTNSSYRWTRALRVPPLPVLSCVLWPEDMRNVVPHSTLGGVLEPNQCCRSPNLEEFNACPSLALLD